MACKLSFPRNTCVAKERMMKQSEIRPSHARDAMKKTLMTCSERRKNEAEKATCTSWLDREASQEALQSIAIMLHQEGTSYRCPDYLSSTWVFQQRSTSSSPVSSAEDTNEASPVDDCADLVSKLELSHEESREEESDSSAKEKIKKSPSSTAVNAANLLANHDSRPVVTPNLEHNNSHLGPWRSQMCGWAYSAADNFGLDREIVAVAFHMLDRYLAKETTSSDEPITREEFQLFTMTALYIAVKMLEPTRKLSIDCIIDMSRGFYSEWDILSTEVHMLHTLEWHLNPPTALAFMRLLLDVTRLRTSPGFVDKCRRVTELAVQDSFLLSSRPSCIAVASILYCAEQDYAYSERSVNQFLARANQLGVSMSQTTAVYRRLEILSTLS